jgi:hypothetical protein
MSPSIRVATRADTDALIGLYDQVFGYYTGARNEPRGVIERKLGKPLQHRKLGADLLP